MERRVWVATSLLAAFCLAGITTLVSQGRHSRTAFGSGRQDPTTTLDPGNASQDEPGRIAPLGLEKGTEVHLDSEGDGEGSEGLILRLR